MSLKSQKYNTILEAARVLFWKYGFKRVSVEEICLKAGASKMTFYRYFRNKAELARSVYDRVVNEGMEKFKRIMRDDNTTPFQKMEQMLLLKMEGTHDISREFLEDFYSNPELGLKKHVEEKSRIIWTEIIKDFETAQRNGWFRQDFKPEGLFVIMNKISELIADEELLQLYPSPQEMIMELARFFTYGIMAGEENT